MSLLDYFSVKKRMNELEAVLTEIIDEQDELRVHIEHVHSMARGLKGAAARNKSAGDVPVVEPGFLELGVPEKDAPMTEEQFEIVHGVTPKEFAMQKIRTGSWV